MDELKDYSKKEILGALTKTDPTTAAARLVDRTQEELKQSAARLAERSAQISFEAFPYEELPDNPNDIPLTSYLNFYPCPPEEYRKEAQQLYGQSIGREKQRHSDAAPKDNGENIHRPAAATIVNTLATLTPMKLVYEHPCLGGLAVIIDCATPNSGQGPLIRLDQLRVYYAYVESLGDDKNNPKYRYGSATVGAVDGKLVIGGPDHCVGQWSTDSLHLVTDDVIASKFHELTQSLLNAKQFSGMMVPSAVYVTTKSSERKPALIQDEVDRIRNSWFDGMRIFFNGLSPVRGIVESIKTNPTNGTLVITIGRNQIVFPAQFKPMVEVDAMVAIGDAIAEPQRPTKEEFGALPKKEQTALTELLIDGACIPLKPKTSRKGSVTVYDHTHVREKGVAFYPQGLIRDADVEYTYGYCDLPLGMAQVWDFGVIHTKKGKYVFNKESLIGDTELSGLHYDFYSPPRPKPVAK